MRPLKLTITGFGPYAETQIIDFEQLGISGIYLIAGDTGTGKTTIFDAIMYALYGTASGDNREASMLRSKYVDEGMPTEVELVFELGHEQYTVKRNPEYMRKKKNKEGFTKQTAFAELTYPDGKVVSQSGNVTKAVENLLGLNRTQFSQVAMISQGEFLRFLLADTQERREIFRKIFHTSLFDAFQTAITEEKNKVNRVRNTALQVIAQDIESVKEIYGEEKIQYYVQNPNEALQILEKELINKENECSDIVKCLKQNEKEINELIEKNAKEEEKIRQLAELEKAEKEKAEKSKEYETVKVVHDTNKKAEEEIKKEEASISVLESLLKNYEELDRYNAVIRENEQALNEQTSLLTAKEKELEEYAKQVAGLEQEKINLPVRNVDIEELVKKEQEYKTVIQYIADIKNGLNNLQNMHIKCKQKQAEREQITSEVNAMIIEARQMRQRFLNAQAGLLAENLTDGIPCPVCGSVHHPALSTIPEDAPTQAEVEAKERLAQERQQEELRINNEFAEQNTLLQQATKNITAMYRAVFGLGENEQIPHKFSELRENLDVKNTEIDKAWKKVGSVIRETKNATSKKEEIEKAINGITNKKLSILTETGNIRYKLSNYETKLSETKERKEYLKSHLAFGSKQEAESEITRRKEHVTHFYQQMEAEEIRIKNLENLIFSLTGKIENLLKMTENIDYEVYAQDKAKLTEHSQKKEEYQQRESCLRQETAVITLTKKQLEKHSKELANADEQWKVISVLADTATGNLHGKEKIALETYVQVNYFERIIDRTNIHFMRMTGGKFELKRKETADTLRNQSGLELSVIDHHNGSERSIKTLSGGESFIASLSLALGMAEEVQASAGGIQIDAMFIDEGFGTLDEETLQLAMKSLHMLSQDNRLIGIISHREELRRVIEKQIVVKKTAEGHSYANIVMC